MKWLAIAFSIFIVAVIVGADTGHLPRLIRSLYDFPNGDKVGHLFLYGFLSLILNLTFVRWLQPKVHRIILIVSLVLAVLIGLEEWSQFLFATRTMDIFDLLASYAGVTAGAMIVKSISSIMTKSKNVFPLRGWVGLALVSIFWTLNWALTGPRTHWGFFPLWLGYCLIMDALVFWRTGTSLLARDGRKYISLFVISAPVWWLFEVMNLRTQNWDYVGAAQFTFLQYAFWTTISFTTVIPAVFGSAEFFASFDFVKRLKPGPVIGTDKRTTIGFFVAGWVMLALLLIWPRIFFPFIWVSIYFILEPVNVWMGNRSLAQWTAKGDWRPVIALWLGVLLTAFFWEMWNYFSYPKWVYHVAWGGGLHVFEMPLLGYGGYLPFALELFALYHLVVGVLGEKQPDYVRMTASMVEPGS